MINQNRHNTAKSSKPADRGPSVLIVEDNVALGESLEMLLETSSFDVSRTTDGVGGLHNINLMDFDIILCDLVMPNLSGDMLYMSVRRVKPHLCSRFIFMTGNQDDPKWEQFARSTGTTLLRKPFTLNTLVNAIREVMQKNLLTELRTNSELQCLSANEKDLKLKMGASLQLGSKKPLWPGSGSPGVSWATN